MGAESTGGTNCSVLVRVIVRLAKVVEQRVLAHFLALHHVLDLLELVVSLLDVSIEFKMNCKREALTI